MKKIILFVMFVLMINVVYSSTNNYHDRLEIDNRLSYCNLNNNDTDRETSSVSIVTNYNQDVSVQINQNNNQDNDNNQSTIILKKNKKSFFQRFLDFILN